MKIIPQGNRVLVELVPYDLERDGIELIQAHKEITQFAKVIAIGDGVMSANGLVRAPVKVGDMVIVTQTGGTSITDGDKKYQLVEPSKMEGVAK